MHYCSYAEEVSRNVLQDQVLKTAETLQNQITSRLNSYAEMIAPEKVQNCRREYGDYSCKIHGRWLFIMGMACLMVPDAIVVTFTCSGGVPVHE